MREFLILLSHVSMSGDEMMRQRFSPFLVSSSNETINAFFPSKDSLDRSMA